eukprot:scaffold1626_cov372-Prasinococcus_capsulatus_cf.AAC.14
MLCLVSITQHRPLPLLHLECLASSSIGRPSSTETSNKDHNAESSPDWLSRHMAGKTCSGEARVTYHVRCEDEGKGFPHEGQKDIQQRHAHKGNIECVLLSGTAVPSSQRGNYENPD